MPPSAEHHRSPATTSGPAARGGDPDGGPDGAPDGHGRPAPHPTPWPAPWPGEEAEALARLAAGLLDAPAAVVLLDDGQGPRPVAAVGLTAEEAPLAASLREAAPPRVGAAPGAAPGAASVADLRADPRLAGHPLVASGPGFRFLAGAALGGAAPGALLVLDPRPRPGGLTSRQAEALAALARRLGAGPGPPHPPAPPPAPPAAERGQAAPDGRHRPAGAAPRDRDARLRLATAGAGIGTFDYCAPSGELIWDDRCRELFGLPPGTPVTYEGSFLAGLHPEDRDRAVEAVRRAMDPRGSGRFACEYRTVGPRDGAERWISANGEVLFEDGAPSRLIGTVLDVTGRRRAEEALRDSEARYRTLFDTMDEGFCVIEFLDGPHGPLSDYVHVEANPAYARHAGIPDVVGRRVREMVGAEADDWVARYGRVLRTGEPIRFERELEATGRLLELSAFRIEPPSRRQVAVLFQDITARRRAERALRGLAASLERQVADRTRERDRFWRLSRDPFLIVDAAGRWLHVSPAWTEILGWTEGELVGRTSAWLEHPDDRAGTAPGTAEAAPRVETRYRARDGGYRWFSWTAVPAEGGLSYRVARDVTEEKERAAARARLEDQLRQSQKMEAVGQLTGGIAHDFNNLLTGIIGALELLGTRMAQGRLKDTERYVGAAQGAARRAAALTHRLLAFSRRQTLDPKPTDVNRLVTGMEDLVRRTLGPAIRLEIVGAGGLWATLVDPPQLENALLNLCINARDAMPDGGRLTIETANRWLDERAARERDLAPGQYLSLCVSDTGTGMAREVIEKAFDPFFTTKPLGQGTGLGLSMIYGFARQSGGGVRIYSEVGAGTMACLYLPRHLGEAEVAEVLPDLADAPRAADGETVLVVDDEPTVRMLVLEVLEELGYAAVEAGDGAAGLKVLQSGARVDLLITDVGLPGGMNGRQMADAARLTRPGLKVLFITGYAENAVVGDGHLEPGMHVMTKPFAMETLAGRIRDLIGAP